MPLIKRIQQARFEPYDFNVGRKANRNYATKIFAADEHLTLQLCVEGFRTKDTERGRGTNYRRVQTGTGTWQLSQALVETQMIIPVELVGEAASPDLWSGSVNNPEGQLWLFQGWVYLSDDQQGLEPEDVRALINVEDNKRRLTLEKAHALQAMSDNYDKSKRRESIPQIVRVEVWQRDGGRCVDCNSQERLEFDHIIPVAMGGGNTSRNLQLLCEVCNRRKGASLG